MVTITKTKCEVCGEKFLHYYKQKRKVCSNKCNGKLVSIRQTENNITKDKKVRIKISKKHKGMIVSNNTKLKISKKMKGVKKGPMKEKTKIKIGKKLKEIWNKRKYKSFARNRRINQKFNKVSKAEIILKDFLKVKKIKYIHQYPYKLGIADFYLPDRNLIIECYGTYWHSKPDYVKRDKKKNKWLKNNGYDVLILKSEDILKGDIKLNE